MKKRTKVIFPVRFRVTPIEIDQKIVGVIEVFQDITREKEIDQMKDEFISMASHELRTPMTAVSGLLSMIFHGDYGPINEKLKHPLNNIQISAQRQIHLINDLLDVSRLQTGKIDFSFTDFSVKPVLEEIIRSLMPIAQQKGITLTLQGKEELSVNADSEWSKHIMNNLIGNALKFTDKGSVSLSYYAKDNNIYIDVTDTGSGIENSDREKLFGKFQQLNGKDTAKPPGSGLGLYLSRELAQKMKGDVLLSKSIVGKGSTFTLILPKTNASAPQSIKTRKEKIAFSPKNK